MPYSFITYGLILSSGHDLPGLRAVPSARNPDIEVRISRTDDAPRPAANQGTSLIDASPLLECEGTGRYRICYPEGIAFLIDEAGRRIEIRIPGTATLEDAATYLQGPVLGFVSRLRGRFCLHASVVSIRGKAIAFAGESGLGKSTLAAALASLGAAVLSDDILVIDLSEDPLLAIPGYPRLRLWPDSAAHLFGEPEALPTMAPRWDKRYLALNGRYRFETSPLPLQALYICSPREDQEYPESIPLSNTAALMTLLAQTYPSPILYPPDRTQQATAFAALQELIATVPVHQLFYLRKLDHLPELCRFLTKSPIPA